MITWYQPCNLKTATTYKAVAVFLCKMIELKCNECQVKFLRKQKGNKYCSQKCYWESKIGRKHSHGHKIGDALRGKPKSTKHVQNVAQALRGRVRKEIISEKHFGWKGDKCGYSSIHDWVKRRIERAGKCCYCGVEDRKIVQKNNKVISYLHLANVSGKYKREVEDWIFLCPRCHSNLDKGRNSIEEIFARNGRPLN